MRHLVLMALACLHLSLAYSAETYLRFEGTIVEEMPCDINDGQPVDLDFGDAVAINKIGGSHFIKPITLNFTCSSNPIAGLAVTILATSTNFDNSAVQTDIGDLGIRLTKKGNGIAFNTPLVVNYPDPLTLMASPVKRAGSQLMPGDFTAFATAVVDYQ